MYIVLVSVTESPKLINLPPKWTIMDQSQLRCSWCVAHT